MIVQIVGMGRSGSTLLEHLLAVAVGGLAVGELVGYWGAGPRGNHLCSCGQPFGECPLWQDVLDRDPRLGERARADRMVGENRRRLPIRRQILNRFVEPLRSTPRWPSWYVQNLELLYSAVLACAPGALIESSKNPVYARAARDAAAGLGVRLRTIHLVRDPRAVAFSLGRHRTVELAPGISEPLHTYGPVRAAAYWHVMDSGARLIQDRYVLRYEDLVREPDEAMSGLLDWLAVPQTRDGGTSHQLVGNPTRQVGDLGEIRPDWEYLDAQSSLSARLVSLLTHRARRRYGYVGGPVSSR